jgi:hypothetical protein
MFLEEQPTHTIGKPCLETLLSYGLIVNSSLTCGGSSGGEGALIALRGSPLGVGTDIGGYANLPSSLLIFNLCF